MISAIVLAAGLSSRMGEVNKLLLEWKGKSLLQNVLDELSNSRVDHIQLVLGHEADRVRASLNPGSWAICINPDYKRGMTTSIQTGVLACPETSTGYMICLSDQPGLTADHYNLVLHQFRKQTHPKTIIQPHYQGKKGNPVIFAQSYKEAILRHQDMTGCREILKTHAQFVVPLEMPDEAILQDVDRPADYEKWKDS